MTATWKSQGDKFCHVFFAPKTTLYSFWMAVCSGTAPRNRTVKFLHLHLKPHASQVQLNWPKNNAWTEGMIWFMLSDNEHSTVWCIAAFLTSLLKMCKDTVESTAVRLSDVPPYLYNHPPFSNWSIILLPTLLCQPASTTVFLCAVTDVPVDGTSVLVECHWHMAKIDRY